MSTSSPREQALLEVLFTIPADPNRPCDKIDSFHLFHLIRAFGKLDKKTQDLSSVKSELAQQKFTDLKPFCDGLYKSMAHYLNQVTEIDAGDNQGLLAEKEQLIIGIKQRFNAIDTPEVKSLLNQRRDIKKQLTNIALCVIAIGVPAIGILAVLTYGISKTYEKITGQSGAFSFFSNSDSVNKVESIRNRLIDMGVTFPANESPISEEAVPKI